MSNLRAAAIPVSAAAVRATLLAACAKHGAQHRRKLAQPDRQGDDTGIFAVAPPSCSPASCRFTRKGSPDDRPTAENRFARRL